MSIPFELTFMDPTPRPGLAIHPDEWPFPSTLVAADDFDREYFGADTLRIVTGHQSIPTLAIKVKLTGNKFHRCNCGTGMHYKARVQVEFLKDGEPSDFTGGWIYVE